MNVLFGGHLSHADQRISNFIARESALLWVAVFDWNMKNGI